MGNCCNKNKEVKVLFIGLDGSGKTSLLNVMKGESSEVETQPTVGFNFETVTHKDVDVNIWDTGGTEQVLIVVLKKIFILFLLTSIGSIFVLYTVIVQFFYPQCCRS